MDALNHLFTFTDHQARAGEGSAQSLQQGTFAALSALAIGALWGAAAGSVSTGLAVANLYKVPMVILLSSLSALPAGLLAWHALSRQSAASFLVAHARGMLGGALILGACAPLVALYSHTSALSGPVIAQVSVIAALVSGAATFAWAALKGAVPRERPRRVPAVALCVLIQLAAALQLNVLAAPILPVPTAFSGGIDGLRGHAEP